LQAIILDQKDNVTTVLTDIKKGEQVSCGETKITALTAVRAGHKLALKSIKKGEDVIKYGYPIGRASRAIRAGEHVHTHNLQSMRGKELK